MKIHLNTWDKLSITRVTYFSFFLHHSFGLYEIVSWGDSRWGELEPKRFPLWFSHAQLFQRGEKTLQWSTLIASKKLRDSLCIGPQNTHTKSPPNCKQHQQKSRSAMPLQSKKLTGDVVQNFQHQFFSRFLQSLGACVATYYELKVTVAILWKCEDTWSLTTLFDFP